MQKVSNRMGYIIDSMYSPVGDIGNCYSVSSNINYENNNVFSLFFKVKVCGNRIELPIFGKETIQTRILASLNKVKKDYRSDIVLPFVTRDVGFKHRSVDSLINYLVKAPPRIHSMYYTAKTNKNECYYGANGLLFDKDMNLLFMSSIECDIEGTTIVYRKVKAYIHPSVFYSDGTVEKCLINKVIPYSLEKGVNVSSIRVSDIRNAVNFDDPDHSSGYHRAVPEVIVADVKDKFFCKPVLPSSTFSDEEVNEFLKENLNDVFNVMKV